MKLLLVLTALFCFLATVRSQCEIVTDATDGSKYDLNPLTNAQVDYEGLLFNY